MEQLLLDTFEGLSLTDRQRKIFSNVSVKRVILTKELKTVTVYIESDHIIAFREIGLLEYALNHNMEKTGFLASVREHFLLSEQYTPEEFWGEYKESVLLILKEKNVLLFNMVYHGEVTVEGNLFQVVCEDDVLFRAREGQFIEIIKEIFQSKAGFLMEVSVDFTLPCQDRQPEGHEVFRRNAQGYFSSTHVRNYYKEKPVRKNSGGQNADIGVDRVPLYSGAGAANPPDGTNGSDVLGEAPGQYGAADLAMDADGYGAGYDVLPDGNGAMMGFDVPVGGNGAMMGFDVPSGGNGAMMGFDVPSGGNGAMMGFDVPLDGKEAAVDSHSTEKPRKEASAKETKKNGYKERTQKGYEKRNTYGRVKSKWGSGAVDEDCFYGRNCDGELIKIADIQGEIKEVVVEGMVTGVEEREIRNEKVIYMFSISDFTDSIMVKIFLEKEELDLMRGNIQKGKFLKLKGNPMYDTYSREITIASVRGIKPGVDTRVKRMDLHEGLKRVELHAHTQMSEMDSVVPVRDFVKLAKSWGHKALAITDHGVVQAFPDADHEVSAEEDFKMLYGVEAYLVDDLIEAVKNDKGQDLQGDFVVFDLETTGIGPKSNQIIEIGAVKVENGKLGERFSTFVNPKRPIPYPVQKLTGIDDSMVAGARTIEEVLPEFMAFCGDCVMVAHNAGFDMGFIMEKAGEQGIDVDFTVVDTVAVARALLPDLKRYKLDTVAKRLGVSLENHHRAVDDAGATAEIFIRMAERLREGLVKKGYPFFLDSPTNQQFIVLPDAEITRLQKDVYLDLWDKVDADHTVVRFATSWATAKEDVDALLGLL